MAPIFNECSYSPVGLVGSCLLRLDERGIFDDDIGFLNLMGCFLADVRLLEHGEHGGDYHCALYQRVLLLLHRRTINFLYELELFLIIFNLVPLCYLVQQFPCIMEVTL